MTTLHDRLADLAEDAPVAAPAPAPWEQGIRYRRRRRRGTAVVLVVAAVALVVLGSATWLRSPSAVEPLPAGSPGGMPDHLYPASEWLPGTAHAGPLGPVAAIFPSVRHTWTGQENGLVGVAATTGEYRFVDLPGLASSDLPSNVWSLSPDGRYIAYLYRDDRGHLAPGAATGVAIYDTSTGVVRRHALPSDLGVKASSFSWTASDTVVVVYGRVVDADGSAWRVTDPALVWNVHVQAPHDLVPAVQTKSVQGAGPGFVALGTSDGSVRVDPATGVVLRRFDHKLPDGLWDASGSRAAEVDTGNSTDADGDPVAVRTVPPDGGQPTTSARVPSVDHAFAVYSWIDEDHLATLVLDGPPDGPTGLVLADVDVDTGQMKRLVTFASGDQQTQLATDLLSRPTVPGIEPPHPLDPRLVTGLGVLVVLVAGSTLIAWRRRVRP